MSGILHLVADPPMPNAPPGFEHIHRYWDRTSSTWTAKLLPGEYYVTRDPEAITTVLGSCISACIRDPEQGCGGMNHFMLPEDVEGSSGSWNAADGGASTRYGAYAMESLINELLKLGACRKRFEVKLFGGGRILPGMTDVGKRNIEFAQSFLKVEGLPVTVQDVGNVYPRRIVFFPVTGKVLLKRLRAVESGDIAINESRYRQVLGNQPGSGDVELFA